MHEHGAGLCYFFLIKRDGQLLPPLPLRERAQPFLYGFVGVIKIIGYLEFWQWEDLVPAIGLIVSVPWRL